MLAKAATVNTIRKEISTEFKRSNTIGTEKSKDFNLKADQNAQKHFWTGVSHASIIQKESIIRNMKNNRFKKLNEIEKIVINNSKDVSIPLS